jgi:hypothetical protein
MKPRRAATSALGAVVARSLAGVFGSFVIGIALVGALLALTTEGPEASGPREAAEIERPTKPIYNPFEGFEPLDDTPAPERGEQ